MGRIVGLEEAAEYCGRKKSTVRQWMYYRKLTKHQLGKKPAVDLDEIDLLMDSETRTYPTAQVVAQLVNRVEKLERTCQTLMFINGRHVVDSLDVNQAKMLYEVAKLECEQSAFTDGEIEKYVVLLQGINEELLDQVELEVNEPHVWLPFYKLGKAVLFSLRNRVTFSTTLQYQKWHDLLLAAQQRIRDAAVLMIEADLDSEARKELHRVIGSSDTIEQDLIQRISWKKNLKRKSWQREPPGDPITLLLEAVEILNESDTDANTISKALAHLNKAGNVLRSRRRTRFAKKGFSAE